MFLLEVVYIRSSEISKKSLESIVKVSGDKIVTGYVRFKKIKSICGYKKACERAGNHLSVITGGRKLENGTYVVKVRYRGIVFLLPLLIGLIFLLIGSCSYQGKEREIPSYVDPEIPTVKVVEDYEGRYISVPGIKAVCVEKEMPLIWLTNPAINDCTLLYQVYFQDELIGESGYVYPGQEEAVEIKIPVKESVYEITVVAKGYSLDKKVEYNSLRQKVKVTCI